MRPLKTTLLGLVALVLLLVAKEVTSSQPFLTEIMMTGAEFCPDGWNECNGDILSISQHHALFALLGTTYGGDGEETFALPDYRGRMVIGEGRRPGSANSYILGQKGGAETVTLQAQHIPVHQHGLYGSTRAATTPNPQNNFFAQTVLPAPYCPSSANVASFASDILTSAGMSGNLPHENMAPSVVSFCSWGLRLTLSLRFSMLVLFRSYWKGLTRAYYMTPPVLGD